LRSTLKKKKREKGTPPTGGVVLAGDGKEGKRGGGIGKRYLLSLQKRGGR